MANGLLDFLTADYATRQQRTRDLNDRLGGLLDYYLGPTGIPDRLRSLNALLNPIDQIGEAGANTVVAFDPTRPRQDRIEAALNAGLGTATALAPAVAGKLASQPARRALMETITGTSGQADVAPSAPPSEPRGILAYQGSPHDFAAERLVRMPDGSTQYIVGAPDVLPDVPSGAEVIQDFPLGRVRMDKIGTGEGAQAYGYGPYFAENEGIARGYRDALSARAAPNDARGNAFDLVQRMGGDIEGTVEILRDAIDNAVSPNTEQFLRDTLKHIEDKTFTDFERPLGRLYEVNINANPENLIDWDKPLSEQPEIVRKALDATGYGPRVVERLDGTFEAYLEGPDGFPILFSGATREEALEKAMTNLAGANVIKSNYAPLFSRDMAGQGVAGIRYLDAGSRGMGYEVKLSRRGEPYETEPIQARSRKEAEALAQEYRSKGWGADIEAIGSRNYVVFDENLINIVRKYGIAGAAAMLGVSTMDVEQAMAQGAQPQGLLSTGVQ